MKRTFKRMTIYNDVLHIAQTYMGIAAREYIDRRCRVSLEIANPNDMKKEDIERLAAGVEMSAGAYMGEEKVKKFKEEILKLKDKHQ